VKYCPHPHVENLSECIIGIGPTPDKSSYRKLALRQKPVTDKAGGLKGSTQHWPAVYPPEFEIPRFVVAGY
jgi:hypothetical protein